MVKDPSKDRVAFILRLSLEVFKTTKLHGRLERKKLEIMLNNVSFTWLLLYSYAWEDDRICDCGPCLLGGMCPGKCQFDQQDLSGSRGASTLSPSISVSLSTAHKTPAAPAVPTVQTVFGVRSSRGVVVFNPWCPLDAAVSHPAQTRQGWRIQRTNSGLHDEFLRLHKNNHHFFTGTSLTKLHALSVQRIQSKSSRYWCYPHYWTSLDDSRKQRGGNLKVLFPSLSRSLSLS